MAVHSCTGIYSGCQELDQLMLELCFPERKVVLPVSTSGCLPAWCWLLVGYLVPPLHFLLSPVFCFACQPDAFGVWIDFGITVNKLYLQLTHSYLSFLNVATQIWLSLLLIPDSDTCVKHLAYGHIFWTHAFCIQEYIHTLYWHIPTDSQT